MTGHCGIGQTGLKTRGGDPKEEKSMGGNKWTTRNKMRPTTQQETMIKKRARELKEAWNRGLTTEDIRDGIRGAKKRSEDPLEEEMTDHRKKR